MIHFFLKTEMKPIFAEFWCHRMENPQLRLTFVLSYCTICTSHCSWLETEFNLKLIFTPA